MGMEQGPLNALEPAQTSPLATRGAQPVTGVTGAIGNTPLVKLTRFLDRSDIDLYVKLEYLNPGGSMKDRPAAQMLESALLCGEIGPDTLVVESSSGNMGIGLAQACAQHGLRFRCVVDPRAQAQNIQILEAYGAEIDLVREPDPSNGDYLTARLRRVEEILRTDATAYWPNQYANPNNPLSHEVGTMREIDDALGGRIDSVFVATSSTGTAGGCDDLLRQRRRSTAVIAVDAVGSVLFGGAPRPRHIPGLGAGLVPPLASDRHFAAVERVTDFDCVVGCRRLARREGILVGGSAGGVLQAVRSQSGGIPANSVVVAILADSGTRYLETIYSDQWVHSELGHRPDDVAAAMGKSDLSFMGTAVA